MDFLKQVQPSGTLENKYESRMMQLSTRRAMVCTCIHDQFELL